MQNILTILNVLGESHVLYAVCHFPLRRHIHRIIPNIYIFEFKLDGPADDALKQIEDKGYARPYLAAKHKLFKTGVVFSSETGTVSDWKVKE